MLDRLRNWATEQLTSKELHNIERQTAWHLEVAKGKLEALGKLWECANEELRPQESCKFLLNKDDKERTAWHVAAKLGNVRVFKNLWESAKERQTTDELKHTLFLTKNIMRRPAWNDAAETKNTNALDVLWEWGKGELTTEELSYTLLLAKADNQKNQMPGLW